jgi:hypothetical protein
MVGSLVTPNTTSDIFFVLLVWIGCTKLGIVPSRMSLGLKVNKNIGYIVTLQRKYTAMNYTMALICVGQ